MPRATRSRSRSVSISEPAPESEAKKSKKSSDNMEVFVDDENNVTLSDVRVAQMVEYKAPNLLEEGRTSSLSASNMHLTGHKGAVYTCAFDPSGNTLASAGMDKNIFLWDTFGAECRNFNVMIGHKNAVLEIKYSTLSSGSPTLISCSADKTVGVWDCNKGMRTRKLTEHTGIVNCCAVSSASPQVFVSGSDDCTASLWDIRNKKSTGSMFHDYQVCSTALADDGYTVYTAGVDGVIRQWDLRADDEPEEEVMRMSGHTDIVTGLSLSPDGNMLLSNSMDNSIRAWNVRPFTARTGTAKEQEQGAGRLEKMFLGARHGTEKALIRCNWSPSGEQVVAGSADRCVHIWDAETCEALYMLPGHAGSVNDVRFHPNPHERVIASASSDRNLFLGELN